LLFVRVTNPERRGHPLHFPLHSTTMA
jgi:hypothetical protein